MRPLETLHNNLCFKNLNNFLTRMINDSAAWSSASSMQNKLNRSLSSATNLSNNGLVKISENFESLELRDNDQEV